LEPTSRLAELFQGATSADVAERDQALAAAERENLDEDLHELLSADQRNNDGFLSGSLIDRFGDAGTSDGSVLAPGTELGRCRIKTLLFRGERSAVYLAEQPAAQRLVAIKVLHERGAGEILVRFEQERRIVAMMRHENIAALYDAGASADGNAYFVMEYVDGRPITEFCEAENLPTADRLRLFLQLCAAVGHAHHRGVIHRDLKPANILVTRAGSKPIVKVIDFGIAKFENPVAAGATSHGQILGTIGYMSPEQIERGGASADTRSDCYSLGAVLYEILAGTPAVPTQGSGPLTVISRIAMQEPQRMSRIRPRLSGDLERIVAMAMCKDMGERYQSVESLRADIERWLEGRPVAARAASPLYVLGRLIRRHRRLAAVVVLLFVIAAVSGVRWWNAERDRFDLALAISHSWFEQSRAMAKRMVEHSQRGPSLARLDLQSAALHEQAAHHPGVMSLRADVLGALGDIDLELDDPAAADRRFREVLELRSRLARRFPRDVDRVADWSVAIVRVGDVACNIGNCRVAKERFLQALDIDRDLVERNPCSARARTLLAWSFDRLGAMASREKNEAKATELYEESLKQFLVLVTLEDSADAHRGLSSAYLHTGARAGQRGDCKTHRSYAKLAMDEANKAVALSPRDRLAAWSQVWARQAFFAAARKEMTQAAERVFALHTLNVALQLVDQDPSDSLGHDNYFLALVHAAECAERAGKPAEARGFRQLEAEKRQFFTDQKTSRNLARARAGRS
jgi:serine/threonine protein kinase